MTESQKKLIDEIKWALSLVEVWSTTPRSQYEKGDIKFTYLGTDEELLRNKPEIKITIKWKTD